MHFNNKLHALFAFPYIQLAQSRPFKYVILSKGNKATLNPLNMSLHSVCSEFIHTQCYFTIKSNANKAPTRCIIPSQYILIYILLNHMYIQCYLSILSEPYTIIQIYHFINNLQHLLSLSLFSMSLHSFVSKANCNSDSLPRNNQPLQSIIPYNHLIKSLQGGTKPSL